MTNRACVVADVRDGAVAPVCDVLPEADDLDRIYWYCPVCKDNRFIRVLHGLVNMAAEILLDKPAQRRGGDNTPYHRPMLL